MKPICIKTSITFLCLLATLFVPVSLSAQFNPEKKADQLYDDFAYSKAVELYEELYQDEKENTKYIQRLAYSYHKMLKFKKAMLYYSLLVHLDSSGPQDYYDYAQLLRIAGKFNDSKVWLQKYMLSFPDDQKAKKQLDFINMLLNLRSGSDNLILKNLEGNTRFIEMCPAFYHDRLVYSTSRDSFTVIIKKYSWDNQAFLDLHLSKPGLNPNLKGDKSFLRTLNSWFHEGPVCFTTDFNTIYFTRNSILKGNVTRTAEGINNLKIFIADFDGKKWRKIRGLPFNSENYSVGHPALSPDNKTLYFVSDMPGGYGETDVYKSEWINGEWGKPQNLGETINTKGKEMFPYVDQSGILYFASNGQPGLGGLDIFAVQEDGNGGYLVVNLDSPINSAYDDFGFIIQPDSLTGYLSSNRPGGKGNDDIYSFAVIKIELKVRCYDNQTKKTIPDVQVGLLTADGKVIESRHTDQEGTAMFSVKPGTNYRLMAEDKAYPTATKDIRINDSMFNSNQQEDIFLEQPYRYLSIKVVDKESGAVIPDVSLTIAEGAYDASSVGPDKGKMRMKLNQSTDYQFQVSANDYFEKTVQYSSAGKGPGEYELTIELEKMATGKQFVLDDLYYDVNKSNIRADAALVLDKLLKIVVDNPDLKIEIGSHTDCRATALYNEKLSQKRSESVVAYLVGKGIEPVRLQAKGYGESQLINKCADGVTCSETEHQANRRTVVKILDNDVRKVYRVEKNVYYF